MRLLLDLGNTRLKWVALDSDVALASGAVAWSDPVAAQLTDAWRMLASPVHVVAGSVVDEAREAEIAALVAQRFSCAVDWVRSPAVGGGVRNAYVEPAKLGVDRFLGMVAARADGLAPCVLASVGTALTLDALSADGQHLGGLIAPGPQLMRQSLLTATARVRPEQIGAITGWADNTADAVASGCWGACAGLIERFVRQVAAPLGGSPQLLLGGGDALPLRDLLALPNRMYGNGVLRGLAVWSGAPMAPDASH